MGLITEVKDSISRATSSLFSAQEPRRIGIYGPPNAGKCLSADEEVLLADGTYSTIENVFESVRDSCPNATDVSDEPDETWLECNTDVRVPALTEDLEVRPAQVSHVFRQRYDGPMYRVRTRLGREVTVSPNHPFIAATGNGFEQVRAADVTKRLPVAALPFSSPYLAGRRDESALLTDGGITTRTPELVGLPSRPAPGAVWERIAEIEQVQYDGYIYDLTVKEHHTFATADGLVVHNTTLANRIARDWTGDAVGPESHIPHETRRARRKEDIEIERNGKSVKIDIVDTPGVATKVDYTEFLEHDIDKEDAIRRSREATEGVAEAMHWLREDVDGVIYVLDSTEDPFTQVNTMLVGIIESQNLPVLILANKIDLEESSVQRIHNAFPQHETIPLSALEGDNMDEVYDKIAEYFG